MSVRFLKALLLWVLPVSAWAVAQPAVAQGSRFTVIHLSDTHVCQLEGVHPKLAQSRQRYGAGFEPLRLALTTLPPRVGADAVAITGDLVDSWEIESPAGDLRADQIDRFVLAAADTPVPVWLTLGNHDIRTHAVSQRIVSRQGNPGTLQPHAEAARAAWIRRAESFRGGTYYFRDIQVGATPWRLYFLNNGYYPDDDLVGDFWDLAQLHWLEFELDKTPGRKSILFFHVPLHVHDTNGDGVRFKEPPAGWPFPDTHERGLLRILNQHPSVVAAFVGHGHKNIIEDIPLPAGHVVTQVETGAFALNRENWRVIEVSERRISISKPGNTGTERTVELAEAGVLSPSTAPRSGGGADSNDKQ
jgi:3',5'-cyclic AMP phosphodiesterase CpdA